MLACGLQQINTSPHTPHPKPLQKPQVASLHPLVQPRCGRQFEPPLPTTESVPTEQIFARASSVKARPNERRAGHGIGIGFDPGCNNLVRPNDQPSENYNGRVRGFTLDKFTVQPGCRPRCEMIVHATRPTHPTKDLAEKT